MNSRFRDAAYWAATGTIALCFFLGGVAYVAGTRFAVSGLAELGYPAYVVPLLGVLKASGAVVLCAPRLPRLKEWAYAGITFDLIGAAVSHAASSHPATQVIVPLVLLAIAMVSWALRPESRQLAALKSIGGSLPARSA